jgi:hypothetical protein
VTLAPAACLCSPFSTATTNVDFQVPSFIVSSIQELGSQVGSSADALTVMTLSTVTRGEKLDLRERS